MRKLSDWWKTDKRYMLALQVLLAALLPILCCLMYCGVQGRSIGEVYLPSSEWNDELFYFKQVEGMVRYGYPQGYFGFNESHALKLSFAAWSPVLVFPWVLWGKLFGWTLMSPIISNILFLTLAVAGFVLLVRPTWKQEGILALLFCLYTPFVRYMLSGMPEIICFSLLILFYGLAWNYLKKETVTKLVILLAMGVVMTWMRPYLLIFLVLPLFFMVKKWGMKGAVGAFFVLATAGIGYALIKHYLGAEYFADLFFTDWISAFFSQGLFGGLHYFFGKLYYMGKAFFAHTIQSFKTCLASGAFFAGFLAVGAVLVWQTAADLLKARKEKKAEPILFLEAHLLFSFVGMFFALLLMYKLTEGSKHLLTFIAVGIFVVSLMDTKGFKKAVFLGLTFAYFYTHMATSAYDYQVPFTTPERQQAVETWQQDLGEKLVLNREKVPSFDNVVIWVLSEEREGQLVSSKWQLFYALPAGFGISCCEGEFVEKNLDSLNSRYIAGESGSRLDELCRLAGYTQLKRDGDLVLYQRR